MKKAIAFGKNPVAGSDRVTFAFSQVYSTERIVAAYENRRFTASIVFSTSASPPSGPQKLEADLLL